MTLEARNVHGPFERNETAGAALSPGDIVQAADGTPGIVAGSDEVASGDNYTLLVGQVVEAATASGTTFSAGATVGWNNTTKLCVTGGTGDFDIGTAVKAKTSGQLVTRVQMFLPKAL